MENLAHMSIYIPTYRVYQLYDIRTKKHFKNEQGSRDAAAKKS